MNSASLTIVMYHYVRPLHLTRFPEIRGLDLTLFREQLAYLRRNYHFISGDELLDAVRHGGRWDFPRNAVLLTFDDGYLDHYQYVFPILDERRIAACFFPPASVVLDRRLLDVNRIHFVLAHMPDKSVIVQSILDTVNAHRAEFDLPPNEMLYAQLAVPSRYDTAEVNFIKRLLQEALPSALRSRICQELFTQYVSRDEQVLAEELYLGVEQLRCMRRHGMYIGGHGDMHVWMNRIDISEQKREVDRSLEMLRLVNTPTDHWMMCYPYGESDDSLRQVLRERGCAIALTTEVGLASSEADPLLMPRLDTNDLPKVATASPNEWTQMVMA